MNMFRGAVEVQNWYPSTVDYLSGFPTPSTYRPWNDLVVCISLFNHSKQKKIENHSESLG
jgi:hypothetical protein